MTRERKLPKKPKKPGDKFLRQARQWEYLEGKKGRGRTQGARHPTPVTRGVPSGRKQYTEDADSIPEYPPVRQVLTFPPGEDLQIPAPPRKVPRLFEPPPVVKEQPYLPGLSFPPDPEVAQPRVVPQEALKQPGGTSGTPQEDSEAPGSSGGLVCPVLGDTCLGFQCQWFDMAANNCAIVSQLDYASGIRGELSILFEYLKYLDKRLSQSHLHPGPVPRGNRP